MSRLTRQEVQLGEPLHLQTARDRQKEIEKALEELRQKRLAVIEAEIQQLRKNAQAEAAKIIADAQAQGKEIVLQSEAVREQARQEGFQEGSQKGYEDSFAKTEAEICHILDSAKAIFDCAREGEQLVLKNFSHSAVLLIRHIASRVIGEEITASPEKIQSMLLQALAHVKATGKIRFAVSPETLEVIRSFSPTTGSKLDSLNQFEWELDPQLNLLDIYLLGETASYDISPTTQVERLVSAVEKDIQLDASDIVSSDVDISPVELSDAKLSDAKLSDAKLSDAIPTESETLTSEESLKSPESPKPEV